MYGNQSGTEKDNRLLFGEQCTLLFSTSKMVLFIFSQSGAELRTMDAIVFQIQDGHHKFQPIRSRIKNSRWWHPRKLAMLENSPPASTEDWDRSHGFPWRQGHAKKCHATSKSILTVSCGPKRQRSVQQVAMMETERLVSEALIYLSIHCKASWDGDLIGNQP